MRFVQNFAVGPLRYRDSRRDRRLVLPTLRIEIDSRGLSSCNWSLTGILLDGEPPPGAALDAVVSGTIAGTTRQGPGQVPFESTLVRIDPQGPSFALRFAMPDPRLAEFLHDCLMRHLAREGGPR